jgi:hypothetical protein
MCCELLRIDFEIFANSILRQLDKCKNIFQSKEKDMTYFTHKNHPEYILNIFFYVCAYIFNKFEEQRYKNGFGKSSYTLV